MSVAAVASVLRDREGLDAGALSAVALADAVLRHCEIAGLTSDALAVRVASDAGARSRLVADLLVHDAQFFDDPRVFDHFRGTVVARAAGRDSNVRILSAACGAGQEPYSAAIALLEGGVRAGRVAIDALERSPAFVERARTGRFDSASLRGLSPYRRERWCSVVEGGWRVSPEVRIPVRFSVGSVLDDLTLVRGPYDAIFCRGVLPYLVPVARERVLGIMRSALADGGALYLDPAE